MISDVTTERKLWRCVERLDLSGAERDELALLGAAGLEPSNGRWSRLIIYCRPNGNPKWKSRSKASEESIDLTRDCILKEV
jgi:hypothetical protein